MQCQQGFLPSYSFEPVPTTRCHCRNCFCFQVNGAASSSTALSSSDYSVLRDNTDAHMVKISRGVRRGAGPMFGYIIFSSKALLCSHANESIDATNGPIKKSSGPPCLITAQLMDVSTLAVSLSSPDLKIRRDPNAPSWCPRDDQLR